MDLNIKLLDSMTKVMPTSKLPVCREYLRGSALRGEVFSFQAAYNCPEGRIEEIQIEVTGPLAEYTRVRSVGVVPGGMLTTHCFDENILTDQAGMFPDPLYDITENGVVAVPAQYRAVYIQVRIPADQAPGNYEFKLRFSQQEKEVNVEKKFTLEVVDALLPRQRIDHTEWFYCDCISNYYNCEVWSEEFWQLLENYFRSMADHGITQILTPVLTPPLDTAVGAERKTAQLLDIETDGKGNWSFKFDRLQRWFDLAKKCGLRRFEFSHIFTQWGAEFAPKVIAKTPEGVKKVFGWETKADSAEYTAFIKAMIGALADYVEKAGMLDCCCMHISDEPQDFSKKAKTAIPCQSSTKFPNSGKPVSATCGLITAADRKRLRPTVSSTIPADASGYWDCNFLMTGLTVSSIGVSTSGMPVCPVMKSTPIAVLMRVVFSPPAIPSWSIRAKMVIPWTPFATS